MSNYNSNGVNLDTLFKARVNTKRADVGFKVNGIDISNRYEKTQVPEDRILFNTNIQSGGVDLKTYFASISYKKLSFSYYTVGESWERYGRHQDGQIHVTILGANFNESGAHNFSVRVFGGNSTESNFGFGADRRYSDTTQTSQFLTDSTTFSFYNLNSYQTFNYGTPEYRYFTVIVTDNNSGKTHTITLSNLGISYNGVPTISAITVVDIS